MANEKKAVAKKPKASKPKTQYIVVWDEDTDPAMVFDSLTRAKEFVSALLMKDTYKLNEFNGYEGDPDDVQEGSIKVYEGVLIGKPKVSIEFSK